MGSDLSDGLADIQGNVLTLLILSTIQLRSGAFMAFRGVYGVWAVYGIWGVVGHL